MQPISFQSNLIKMNQQKHQPNGVFQNVRSYKIYKETKMKDIEKIESFNIPLMNKQASNSIQHQSDQTLQSFEESSITSTLTYKLKDKISQIDKNFGNSIGILENNQSGNSTFRKKALWDLKSSRQQIIQRADHSVRQLSAQNRIKSCDKIKSEEICFRFKLKMMALLRFLSFKLEDVQKLKELQPQDFIFNFTSKLKTHFKNYQAQLVKMKQKYDAIVQTLKVKNEQLNQYKQKLTEKQKQVHSINLKSMNQYKEHKNLSSVKQKQIDNLYFAIHDLKNKINKANKSIQKDSIQKITNNINKDRNQQIQNLNKEFSSKKKQCQSYQNRIFQLEKNIQQQKNIISALLEQIKNAQRKVKNQVKSAQSQTIQIQTSDSNSQNLKDKINQDIITQKMSQIIQQWKNHMYSTVNDYERILQNCNQAIRKKDEQIKCLKVIAKKYFNNKLN